jgi:SnoaL-like domain
VTGSNASNMGIILGGIANALRSQDIDHLAGMLDRDVIWEGLSPDQDGHGRDQAAQRIRDFFGRRRLTFDAVEVIVHDDTVVVGVRGPRFSATPGNSQAASQVFLLFTMRHGAVVHSKIYPQREEALAAAEAADPAPAACDMADHFWGLRGWRPDREL